MSAAALAVMAGHAYPIFLKFRGGKPWQVLSSIPVSDSDSACSRCIPLRDCVAASRHISLGSIVAAGCLPLAVWLIEHPPAAVLLASLIAGAFHSLPAQGEHRKNPRRIRACFPLQIKSRSSEPEAGNRARHRSIGTI